MHKLFAAAALAAIAGCAWHDDGVSRYERQWPIDPFPESMTWHNYSSYVRDPVTGQRVQLDTPWMAKYDDRTYYFRSPESMERFQRNPDEFVAGREAVTPPAEVR